MRYVSTIILCSYFLLATTAEAATRFRDKGIQKPSQDRPLIYDKQATDKNVAFCLRRQNNSSGSYYIVQKDFRSFCPK